MQNLFIGENEEIVIKFSVATNKEGSMFCDLNEESLKESLKEIEKDIENYTIGNYEVVFKKPSFKDIKEIYNKVYNSDNPVEIRYNKIVALIKNWDLRGKKEESKEEEVRRLHPLIAECIGIQLDAEIDGVI